MNVTPERARIPIGAPGDASLPHIGPDCACLLSPFFGSHIDL